jgi:hypothetical protein
MLRDVRETFPMPADPLRYGSARIWHCRFHTLSGLSRLANLRKLEIAGYPDTSLDVLRGLSRLKHLSIVHLPEVTSLEPLSSLAALRCLTLAALPPWDRDSKPVKVDSLAPLRSLPALEEVNLFGVQLADRSVKVLWRLPSLRRVRLGDRETGRVRSFQLADGW